MSLASVSNADLESVAPAVARLPGAGFTVKPMVFQYLSASLLVKPMSLQRFRLPDL